MDQHVLTLHRHCDSSIVKPEPPSCSLNTSPLLLSACTYNIIPLHSSGHERTHTAWCTLAPVALTGLKPLFLFNFYPCIALSTRFTEYVSLGRACEPLISPYSHGCSWLGSHGVSSVGLEQPCCIQQQVSASVRHGQGERKFSDKPSCKKGKKNLHWP